MKLSAKRLAVKAAGKRSDAGKAKRSQAKRKKKRAAPTRPLVCGPEELAKMMKCIERNKAKEEAKAAAAKRAAKVKKELAKEVAKHNKELAAAQERAKARKREVWEPKEDSIGEEVANVWSGLPDFAESYRTVGELRDWMEQEISDLEEAIAVLDNYDSEAGLDEPGDEMERLRRLAS